MKTTILDNRGAKHGKSSFPSEALRAVAGILSSPILSMPALDAVFFDTAPEWTRRNPRRQLPEILSLSFFKVAPEDEEFLPQLGQQYWRFA